jgi:pimeloyl-ACP methyl ester carboxylesterase
MKNDLLVFGAGYLGSRVAKLWKNEFPDSSILEITSKNSDSIKQKFSNVIFCIPPSQLTPEGETQSFKEVEKAIGAFNGIGKLVVVSSTGVYAENSGGEVDEKSEISNSDRAQKLIQIEKCFLNASGSVVRLAGLYGEDRGPHLSYLRENELGHSPGVGDDRGESEGSDTFINLIQIDDAAKLCVLALKKAKPCAIYVGCDENPVTRETIKKTSKGKDSNFISASDKAKNILGKKCNGDKARIKLGFSPRWKSFKDWAEVTNPLEGRVLKSFKSHIVAVKNNIPSKEAVFLFHGFPANRSGKNLDIAMAVFKALKIDAYIIHYRGLGDSPGYFSFSDSVFESVRSANEILAFGRYAKLHIYGHSWGSVVASNVAFQLKERCQSLMLACPLTKVVVDDPMLTGLVHSVLQEMPDVFGPQSLEDVRLDLQSFTESSKIFQPWDLAPKLDQSQIQIKIVQALKDEYTPPAKTRELIKRFSQMPIYVEYDVDHSFMEDRKLLAQTVIGFLRD